MRRILTIMLATVLLAVLSPGAAAADDRAYTCDNAGNISLLNFTTGSKTLLGNVSAVTGTLIESMAHDPATGLVYAVNSSGEFFRIIPSAATATLVSNLGTGNVESLDMIDGRLIGMNLSSAATIYEINPASGIATAISTASPSFTSGPRGLAMLSSNEGLVSSSDNLAHLDFNTGVTTPIGPFGVAGLYCMDRINGTLYGVHSTTGDAYKINPATGAATLIGNFGGGWYLGLASIEDSVGDWAYSNDSGGGFYALNFTSPSSVLLGNTIAVTGVIESMAHDPGSGMVFAINTGGDLFRIDPVTAVATLVGSTGLGNVEALDSIGGRLTALQFANPTSAYDIDMNTATPTLLSIAASPVNSVPRSVAMVNADLAIFWDGASLVEYVLSTGSVTVLGPTAASMYGMDFINGSLYGITGGAVMHQINETNGSSVSLGGVAGGFFLSLAGIDTVTGAQGHPGELTASSRRWDRVKDAGFVPGPYWATFAFDSFNDGQPYDEFVLRQIDPGQPVIIEMRSLEATLADFDPFLAAYCNGFVPSSPELGAFAIDDDGDFTTQDARIEIAVVPAGSARLIASSYASYAPARYGRYELVVTNGTLSPPCYADVNWDGILDNGDIGLFVSLFLSADPAADLNGDGILDNGDINTFVTLFLAGC
ncbi:MAG: hypothetical protein ACI89L_000631 [Phycisphaerales bacterium]|jgi:hypothetical protein